MARVRRCGYATIAPSFQQTSWRTPNTLVARLNLETRPINPDIVIKSPGIPFSKSCTTTREGCHSIRFSLRAEDRLQLRGTKLDFLAGSGFSTPRKCRLKLLIPNFTSPRRRSCAQRQSLITPSSKIFCEAQKYIPYWRETALK